MRYFDFPFFNLHRVRLWLNMRTIRIGIKFREFCSEEQDLGGIKDPKKQRH